MSEDHADHTIHDALDLGYRRFDTAAMYGNEALLGQALACYGAATAPEVCVTTKIWNADHGHRSALEACERSRRRLGVPRVGILLIHWPCPARDQYVETWRAMIELQKQGLVETIGVSNFQIEHIERLIGETGVVPVMNQVELHPHFQQRRLRTWHAERGIATEAWSPLGRGSVFEDTTLQRIARRHNRSVAQVVLRWHLQVGNLAIPKASSRERLRQNIELGDFYLDDRDLDEIDSCDRNERGGPDPCLVN
ncbi:aldo/keto reductase [Nocardioides terrisoli]|uniref:aldo/keto reductase n=1 Tax=Nocardioides terrisoli TaxID=3388267 RepID=UPI00287B8C21|nr:aldo/keto reductase [Nocardioides marmorisolisilvae]